MTVAERTVMGAHAAHLQRPAADGKAGAFGPVADPDGSWELGILDVASEGEARSVTENDPAIRAGIGLRYEICPMPAPGLRPGLAASNLSRHGTP